MELAIDERGDPVSVLKTSAVDVDVLFRAYYRDLVRLAVNLVDDQAGAEDVVQDVFAALHSSGHALNNPLFYLRSAVVNRSRSVLRRRRTARLFTVGRARHLEPADASGERSDDQARILQAVRALPDRQRQVIALRYYEELSVAETASMLGITAGAVSSSANRALARLATLLGDDHV